MKELSIEDKARAYDDAKARMSRAYNDNRCTIGFMNEIFPELKESEDERIRKEIINYFECQSRDEPTRKDIHNKWIAWLEKHGEQETDEWKEGNIIRHGGILALVVKGRRAMKSNGELFTVQYPKEWVKAVPNEIECFLNELEKQGEQKPTDEEMKEILRTEYEKGRADAIAEMQNTAWSEEDENRINRLIAYFEDKESFTAEDDVVYANWLKSLKDRYTWKPSEEQMRELGIVATGKGWFSKEILSELLEQLKKLMEE